MRAMGLTILAMLVELLLSFASTLVAPIGSATHATGPVPVPMGRLIGRRAELFPGTDLQGRARQVLSRRDAFALAALVVAAIGAAVAGATS
jgi:hypothetical protein